MEGVEPMISYQVKGGNKSYVLLHDTINDSNKLEELLFFESYIKLAKIL